MQALNPLSTNATVGINYLQQPDATAPLSPLPPATPVQDVVHLQVQPLDAEAQEAMNLVEESLHAQADEALSVHGGLDYARVMALLADL